MGRFPALCEARNEARRIQVNRKKKLPLCFLFISKASHRIKAKALIFFNTSRQNTKNQKIPNIFQISSTIFLISN